MSLLDGIMMLLGFLYEEYFSTRTRGLSRKTSVYEQQQEQAAEGEGHLGIICTGQLA